MIKNGYETSFIGDGVYVYFDGWQVCIYATDGIDDTEVIALEDNTMIALIEFAKNHFSKGVIK